MDSKMLLTCALDIGEKMLISGAESAVLRIP